LSEREGRRQDEGDWMQAGGEGRFGPRDLAVLPHKWPHERSVPLQRHSPKVTLSSAFALGDIPSANTGIRPCQCELDTRPVWYAGPQGPLLRRPPPLSVPSRTA
jgi:hypothetical protein